MASTVKVQMQFTADTNAAKQQINELQNQLKQLSQVSFGDKVFGNKFEGEIIKAQQSVRELGTAIERSLDVDTGKLNLTKLSTELSKSGKSLKDYGAELKNLGPQGQQAFQNLTQQIMQANVQINSSSKFISGMWTNLKNVAKWQMSSAALSAMTGAFSNAFRYAEDLNKSLNNIRIVSGQSVEQMARFAKEANKAAKALSTTTTEYTNASLIFYQQGLEGQAVKDRADIVVKMANVTGDAAQTVSDQMTAVWNNFYDGSKSLEYYADVMTALGAATASSTDEIATGLEKFAATAETVGLSYEYATAALTTVTATTRQSADVVGTAFKTLFARIQDLELGKTLDDGTTLGKYSQALKTVGVNIQTASGGLKEMDDILDETAAKWKTLDAASKTALAQTVAGTRQYTQFMALMDNWDFMEQNLQTANNATGALQEQQEIYEEGWEGASKRVKAAFEGIYDSLINDEFIIDLVDGFGKFLEIIEKIIDSMGGFKGLMSGLYVLMTKIFGSQMQSGIANMGQQIYSFTKAGRKDAEKLKVDAYDTAIDMIPQTGGKRNEAEARVLKDQMTLDLEYSRSKEQSPELAAALDLKKQMLAISGENLGALKEEQVLLESQSAELEEQIEKLKEKEQLSQNKIDGLQSVADSHKDDTYSYYNKAITDTNVSHADAAFRKGEDKDQDAYVARLMKQYKGSAEGAKNYEKQLRHLHTTVRHLSKESKQAAKYEREIEKERKKLNNTSQKRQKAENNLSKTEKEKIRVTEEAAKAEKNYRDVLNQPLKTNKYEQMAASFIKTTSALSQFTMGVSSLKAAWDTIRDPDASGWEKISSLAMSVSMGLTMMSAGYQNLSKIILATNTVQQIAYAINEATISQLIKEQLAEKTLGTSKLAGIVADKLKITTGQAALVLQKMREGMTLKEAMSELGLAGAKSTGAIATGILTAATWAQTAAQNALNLSMSPVAAIILVIVAALAALVAIIWIAVSAVKAFIANSPEGKLKALEEQTEAAKESFNRVTEAVNNTKTAIENLENSKKTLQTLKEGSLEWREEVNKINAEVLKLIELFPELEKLGYITRNNGILGITEEGYEYIEKTNKQRLETANNIVQTSTYRENQQRYQNNLDSKYKTWGGYDGTTAYGNDIQEYYNTFGDAIFTDAGAENFAQYMQDVNGVYGMSTEVAKEWLETNKDIIKEQSQLLKQNQLIEDNVLQGHMKSLGSIRTIEQSKELLGADYSDITDDIKTDLYKTPGEGGFDNDWNDHINYKETDEQWSQIQDFMKLQGDDVKYVAQRHGKMVLEINGEEEEFTEEQFYNALTEMRASDEIKSRITENLKTDLGEALQNVNLEDLDTSNLLALDNMRLTLNSFGEEIGIDGENMFKDIVGAIGTSTEDLTNFTNNLNSLDWSSEENLRKIRAAALDLEDGTGTIENFTEVLEQLNAKDELKSMSSEFQSAAQSLGLGDEAAVEMQEYALQLREIAEENEELSDELSKSADGAADLAIEVARMNKGIETLGENFEDWNSILKKSSKTSAEYTKAMSGMKKAVADILDVSTDFVSSDFITSNMDDIALAAEGNAEAIERLRSQMDEELILKISEGQTDEFIAKINDLDQKFKELDFPDIQVGAILDDSQFLEAANRLVQESNMTADEANAYFAGIGYEPVYNSEEIDNSAEIPNSSTRTYVESINWEEADVDLGLFGNHQIKLPAVTTKTESVPSKPSQAEGSMRLTSFSGGSTPPPIRGLRKKATGSMNNYSSSNSGGTTSPKKSGGGGGSKSPEKKTLDKKSDTGPYKEEKNRYADINNLIEQNTYLREKNSKTNDHAVGLKRAKAIAEETASLKENNKLLEQRLDLAEKDLVTDANEAKKYFAFEFDEDGTILNEEAFTDWINAQEKARESAYDAGVEAYNAMTAEEQETLGEDYKENLDKQYEDAGKSIEDAKEAFEQYKETLDVVRDTESEMADIEMEILSNNMEEILTIFDSQIEMIEQGLDTIDAKISALGDDAQALAKALQLSVDKAPMLATEMQLTNDKIWEIQYKHSQGLLHDDEAYEQLLEASASLYDQIANINEYIEEMYHGLNDILDANAEELEKYTSYFENMVSAIDHYNTVMELTGKDKNYKLINEALRTQGTILKSNAKVSKENYLMLSEQMDIAKADLAAATTKEEKDAAQARIDDLAPALAEAYDTMLSDSEAFAEKWQEILANAIEEAAEDMEKALTEGLGFDALSRQIDALQAKEEVFLTETNQVYETTKLIRTIQADIDSSTNKTHQAKLKAFQKETEQLKNQDKLSRDELEIQQLKYDLLVAEIALEEARDAKNKVRLMRDSQGNFNYVYTADQNAINDAQQKVDDANNALYNKYLDVTNTNAERIQQIQQEFAEEAAGLDPNDPNYLNDLNDLQAKALEKIAMYQDQYAIGVEGLGNKIDEAWTTSIESSIKSTEDFKIATDKFISSATEVYNEYYDEVEWVADNANLDLNSMATTATNLKETVVKEVIPEMSSALSDGQIAIRTFAQQSAPHLNAMVDNFEAVANSAQDAAYAIAGLNKGSNLAEDMLNAETEEDFWRINRFRETKISLFGIEGVQSSDELYQQWQAKQIEKPKEETKTEEEPKVKNTNSAIQREETENKPVEVEVVNTDEINQIKAKEIYDLIIAGKLGTGNATRLANAKAMGYTEEQYRMARNMINQNYIGAFDTGGYTGKWGPEGRWAMLHEKELVLNKDDTANFLDALELTRSVLQAVDLNTIASQYSLTGKMAAATFADAFAPIQQDVHITAEFPNATDKEEIKAAFDDIINEAVQYAGIKRV